jgi:ribonuclease HI
MEILDLKGAFYHIKILEGDHSCEIKFNPDEKILLFQDNNQLSRDLESNQYQLKKILHNKRDGTFFKGFKLKFVLRDNDSAMSFNDLSKLVLLDRRNGEYLVSSLEKYEKEIFRIYTDGCYLEKIKKGAYIALFKPENGLLDLHYGKTSAQSSSLIELMAVIEGLKRARDIECIRIISDSRYIIKGLTEWIFNWKLNDWHTAQGKKVKNIEYWKEFDFLTQNKYIEFEWVKGHSMHLENSICDYYAKQAAAKYS